MAKPREHDSHPPEGKAEMEKGGKERPFKRRSQPPQPRARFSVEHRLMLDLLIDARHNAGLSQAALAQKLGKVQSHVAAVEVGGRDVSGVEMFRWCRAVGLPFSEFARQFEARLGELNAEPNAADTTTEAPRPQRRVEKL